MKKLILVTLVSGSLFSFTACAQKLAADKVPAVVKTSFSKDFPGIITKWEKEKQTTKLILNRTEKQCQPCMMHLAIKLKLKWI